MLKTNLLHPDVLSALAAAGHGSKILIADSNYPYSTHTGQNAELVFLNLAPGVIDVPTALRCLAEAVPIEAAEVMLPAGGEEPPIFEEFRRQLPHLQLQTRSRDQFYEVARSDDLCLCVATGEQRIYACIILTIGVVPPPA